MGSKSLARNARPWRCNRFALIKGGRRERKIEGAGPSQVHIPRNGPVSKALIEPHREFAPVVELDAKASRVPSIAFVHAIDLTAKAAVLEGSSDRITTFLAFGPVMDKPACQTESRHHGNV